MSKSKFMEIQNETAVIITVIVLTIFAAGFLLHMESRKLSNARSKNKTEKIKKDPYVHNLLHAHEGDVWTLDEKNIPLLFRPEFNETKEEFKKNLVVLLDANTTIKVIDRKDSFLDPYIKVNVILPDGRIQFTGWIPAQSHYAATRTRRAP